MLCSIKIENDLKRLNETALLNQVAAIRLQDKLGKQNFNED